MSSSCQRLVTKIHAQPCSRETQEGDALCMDCLWLLHNTLEGIKEIIEDLEVQITKQDVGAKSVGGGGSNEPKLPFDIASSEALEHIEAILEYWYAKNSAATEHVKLQGLSTEQRVRILVHWHLQQYVRTGRVDTGPGMLADFDGALSKAVRAIDRKTTRVWIGNCSCGKPVHAYPNQRDMVECECGLQYDPTQSRRDMRVLGGQQIVSARQAEALGEIFGRTIKRQTVLRWHQRGKIQCHSEDCTKGCSHQFRMSDILTLHREV